ncbi:hypothetical protein EAE96_010048 [Botrytis aclada]|nr:hypothetical protein EAE96_010048 [Botrytis aclada]
MAHYKRSYKDGEVTGIAIEIEQCRTDLGSGSPKVFSTSVYANLNWPRQPLKPHQEIHQTVTYSPMH